MRILHVLDHSLPVSDGYSLRSHWILREQRRLGWDTVQVTGPKQGEVGGESEDAAGIRYLRTAGADRAISRLPILDQVFVVSRLRARLREIIARTQPDLVHAHSPCLNGLAALDLGPPVLYELRSSWEDAAVSNGTTREGSIRYRASRALETYVLRRSGAVTTICDGLRADVVSRGIDSRRVTIIPNAVDPGELAVVTGAAALAARAKYRLDGKCVLGFVGSFFAWEGLSLLLEAAPAILARHPDVRILLVGGGHEDEALRSQAAHLGLADIVVFAGHVPHADVGSMYSAIDVLVYPRLPMRLTEMVTPLKPLEAMSLGKLMVASDVGGHRELIRDSETGVLFPAGSHAALASTVVRLLDDPVLQERCRTRGPQWVRQERTWGDVVARYGAVYGQLMQGDQ